MFDDTPPKSKSKKAKSLTMKPVNLFGGNVEEVKEELKKDEVKEVEEEKEEVKEEVIEEKKDEIKEVNWKAIYSLKFKQLYPDLITFFKSSNYPQRRTDGQYNRDNFFIPLMSKALVTF